MQVNGGKNKGFKSIYPVVRIGFTQRTVFPGTPVQPTFDRYTNTMRTTHQHIFQLFALIVLLNLRSQAQSINYKVVENDPDKRNLFIHLNPFNTQCYMSDISIGYNLQATWITKIFQAQIDYRKAYLDENAQGVFSPTGLKKSSQLEIGGVFNFSHKMKNLSHKVVLHSSSGGGYTYTQYIMVMGEARKIKGFRGGFLTFLSNHKVDNDITAAYTANDLRGKGSDGQVRYVRDSINFETINYIARSVGIYAGIDLKSIRQLRISAEGYGARSNKVFNNFYVDAMFTPLVKYDLKPNAGQAIFKDVDVNISENKRRMLGWRAGWQWILNQPCGFNAKMEIGQQPGVPKKSFFITLGFGMTIGLKAKLPTPKTETK
jgi:hypothetical protein